MEWQTGESSNSGTATTNTTSSSSGAANGVSGAAVAAAESTTSTTTTTGAGGVGGRQAGSFISGSLEIDAQQLRHWASPEELLSIKNLLGDLRLRHSAEMQSLNTALEQSRAECDLLRRDAQAFVRLKDAYMASENDFQRMKQERSSWHEEREMMALKLQQASNEILRLKQQQQQQQNNNNQRGASASSSGSSGGASSSTSTGILSLNGMTSVSDAKFLLALAESEHRHECEARELHTRVDFQQLIHDMSRQRMVQRVAAAESELRVTKEKLGQFKDRTQQQQRSVDHAEIRFAELESVANKKIGEAESGLRAAETAKEMAEKALRELKSELDAKVRLQEEQHRAKIDELLRENSSQCAMLTSSLNRAVATASKADDVYAKEREHLLQELREVNEMLRMERAKSDNTSQQLSQRLTVATTERDDLQGQLHEALTECATLRSRLDVCTETLAALRNEVEELHAANVRTANVEGAVLLKDRSIRQLQLAREATEAKAASAEQQVRTLVTALERERSQSLVALELLQRKREEREMELDEQYRRQIERLERKYRDTKIRLKELIAWREANEMPGKIAASSVAMADAAAAAGPPPRDVLVTMQEQFEAAAALVRGFSG